MQNRVTQLLRQRHFWVLMLVMAVVVSACAPTAPAATDGAPAPAAEAAATEPAPEPTPLPEIPAPREGVFTYWGGLIFSDAANQMLVDAITAWGEEYGIETEVVMINQNETQQRVSAAVEAGTMPSALDMGRGLMLLLSASGELEPVDALYDEIATINGGWLPLADEATNPDRYGGNRYGIPFSLGGNVLYRRNDVLEPVGFPDAPDTWEALGEAATAGNNPPEVYGMGFALSNVGDANITQTMLQSWGGRIADDEGVTCTIDSPETRAFLEWIVPLYEAGLFPPGATTWDGAGDNVAYQSGNAIFIANPGSVYLYLVDNDPELAEVSRFSALPAGPAMRLSPADANVRVIPASSPHKEEAAELFKYLASEEFMEAYYAAAIYGPAAEAYRDAPIFTESPVHAGLLDLAVNGTFGGYPDVDNAAYAAYSSQFLTPRMIQRIVVDGLSIDDSIAETQTACQQIYDENQ
jgi:multiple sugar transport system substrate-binding protein